MCCVKVYKGADNREVLRLLVLKIRSLGQSVSVVVHFSVLQEISSYLWNFSVPHHCLGDPFIEKNAVFVDSVAKPADCLILFENCLLGEIKSFERAFFIGIDHVVEGEYFVYEGGKWLSIVKNLFYNF